MSRVEPVDPRVRLAISRWPDDAPRGAVTTFCLEPEISRKTLYSIRQRLKEEGAAAVLEPKSRRPRSSPTRLPDETRAQAVAVRAALEQPGLDHGPISVHEKMRAMGLILVPSVASLSRIFREAGVARVEPRKKRGVQGQLVANVTSVRSAPRMSIDSGCPITQHQTAEGKLHLCAVKDACSKRIVGHSIDSRMKSSLSVNALQMAIDCRHPHRTVVHSDGSGRRLSGQRSDGILLLPAPENVLDRKHWQTREAVSESSMSALERPDGSPQSSPARDHLVTSRRLTGLSC